MGKRKTGAGLAGTWEAMRTCLILPVDLPNSPCFKGSRKLLCPRRPLMWWWGTNVGVCGSDYILGSVGGILSALGKTSGFGSSRYQTR